MSDYTSKLNLYKVDPAIDGEDTFNINTMMNDNWDKIDEKVGNMDEKLSGVEDNLKDGLQVSEIEPVSYNPNTIWLQDVGDSDFSGGGGINVANAQTSTQPPNDNSYWFEPI
ncbi:hypothetical protein AN1V17_14770 [Vallitalea sediminicola]